MKLSLKWLLDKFKKKAATQPISHAWHDYKSAPTALDLDADALAERQDANIATAIRLIADSISGLPLNVVKKETIDAEETFVVDDEHPANLSLDEPNYFHDGKEITSHEVQSLILGGNSYEQIIKTPNGVELWPIENWKMTMDYDKSGRPVGYIYAIHQPEEQRFKLEEILHIRLYNSRSIFVGRSHIEPVRTQILESYYAELYNKNFFKNDATPGGIFTPDIPINGDEAIEFKKNWEALNKGVDKAHGMLVSTLPGKFSTTSAAHKDVAFLDLIKLAREKCFGVIGIPPTMAGVMEFASYANALMEQSAYWENTIIPFLQLIERSRTRQLMHVYFDREHKYQFDLSGVKALQADSLKKAQTDAIYVRANILTVNEVRKQMDLQPVEWGDEPQSMGSNLVLPGDSNSDGSPNEGGNDNASKGQTRSLGRRALSPRYKLWKKIDNRRTGYEIKYSRILNKYFAGQRDRLIDAIRAKTGKGMMMSMLYYSIKADPNIPDDAETVFNIFTEKEILEQTTKPFIKQAVKDAGQNALYDFGIDVAFSVTNPNVQVAINKLVNRSKHIVDTTFSDIKDLLKDAYDNGNSLGELEKAIYDIYKEYGRTRVTLIARTEMGGVMNAGAQESYTQAGLEQKEWLATQDENTRDGHSDADGQIVNVSADFTVVSPEGYSESLGYPGDPAGSAGNVINCRCTLVPVINEDKIISGSEVNMRVT